jgi:ABC-type lipoprotein release transport system permease subunit
MGSLTLLAVNQHGGTNSIALEVKGLTPTVFGIRTNYLGLAATQDLLGLPGQVTELVAKIDPQAKLETVAHALEAALGPNYEVLTWQQLMPEAEDENQRQAAMSQIVSLLLMILVIFGITNTMMMCVQERRGEIGTMMAMGMESSSIFILFTEEAVIIGLLGSGIGTFAGVAISLIANYFSIPLGSSSPIFADGLRPIYSLAYVGIASGLVVIAATLGGLIPALQAARKHPVEALSHNI